MNARIAPVSIKEHVRILREVTIVTALLAGLGLIVKQVDMNYFNTNED